MTDLYTKNQLKEISGRSPEWVQTVLEFITPVESTTAEDGREFNKYRLSDFIRGVEEKYSSAQTSKARLDEIKFEKASDELKLSRGQLLPAEDVRFYLAEQNKRVIEVLQGLSDQVDRKCSPEVVVLETIDDVTERLFTQMRDAMAKAVK